MVPLLWDRASHWAMCWMWSPLEILSFSSLRPYPTCVREHTLSQIKNKNKKWHLLERSWFWFITCPCLTLKSIFVPLHRFVCKTAGFKNTVGKYIIPDFLRMDQSVKFMGEHVLISQDHFSSYERMFCLHLSRKHTHMYWALPVFRLGCSSQSEILT